MDDTADDVTSDEESIEMELRQRVRIFVLSKDGSEWHEIGIGQISTQFENNENETYLLVHAEDDEDFLLLNSKIKVETVYQKLQDRFIIWTEEDTVVGLSFQQNDGCDDIWQIIRQVQGKSAPESDDIEENPVQYRTNETITQTQIDLVQTRVWFEQMLDMENQVFSAEEREVLEPLMEHASSQTEPHLEDPMPGVSRLADTYHESFEETEVLEQLHGNMLGETEELEQMHGNMLGETEALQQLHGNILYLLSLSRDLLINNF